MSDANAGKYKRHYKAEFECAKKALAPYGGELTWGTADYEAFVYRSDGVRLIFYPHKTTAWNHHIRIRDSGSKDPAMFETIAGALRIAAGNCCTFSLKGRFNWQYAAADKIDQNWILRDQKSTAARRRTPENDAQITREIRRE